MQVIHDAGCNAFEMTADEQIRNCHFCWYLVLYHRIAGTHLSIGVFGPETFYWKEDVEGEGRLSPVMELSHIDYYQIRV